MKRMVFSLELLSSGRARWTVTGPGEAAGWAGLQHPGQLPGRGAGPPALPSPAVGFLLGFGRPGLKSLIFSTCLVYRGQSLRQWLHWSVTSWKRPTDWEEKAYKRSNHAMARIVGHLSSGVPYGGGERVDIHLPSSKMPKILGPREENNIIKEK